MLKPDPVSGRSGVARTAAPRLSIKPATRSTWPDLEALFEAKGGPSYCWCMPFRRMENRQQADNAARKAALYERVDKGVPIGLIGYIGGEAVAWCSVAPRETFTRLSDNQDEGEAGVWSVTCFFVRRDHRGRGITGRMLDAAVKLARRNGAKVVEGYPVDPDSPSYRFMGFTALFEGRGFEMVGRAGSRRHVMRLAL